MPRHPDLTPTRGFAIGDWHRVFAWWPIDTPDEGRKWLCYVERRRIQGYPADHVPHHWWQYRSLRKEDPCPPSRHT